MLGGGVCGKIIWNLGPPFFVAVRIFSPGRDLVFYFNLRFTVRSVDDVYPPPNVRPHVLMYFFLYSSPCFFSLPSCYTHLYVRFDSLCDVYPRV